MISYSAEVATPSTGREKAYVRIRYLHRGRVVDFIDAIETAHDGTATEEAGNDLEADGEDVRPGRRCWPLVRVQKV